MEAVVVQDSEGAAEKAQHREEGVTEESGDLQRNVKSQYEKTLNKLSKQTERTEWHAVDLFLKEYQDEAR